MQMQRIIILLLVAANLAVFAYGILTVMSPAAIESGFVFFTKTNFALLQVQNGRAFEYLSLTIRLLGAFNLSLAMMNIFNVLYGYFKDNKTVLLMGLVGSLLAYLPSMAFDGYVGYFGPMEILEYIFGASIVLIFIFWRRK